MADKQKQKTVIPLQLLEEKKEGKHFICQSSVPSFWKRDEKAGELKFKEETYYSMSFADLKNMTRKVGCYTLTNPETGEKTHLWR